MKRTDLHNRVATEAQGKADADFCRYVREPKNLDDWHRALVDLRQDIEQQVTERKTALDAEHVRCLALGDSGKAIYFEVRTEFQKWRQVAGRFKQAIDHRHREVKILRRQRSEAQSGDETWALLKLADKLIPREGDGLDWHERFDKLKTSET